MLAYVFWHRPAAGVDAGDYERRLQGLHRSLAHRPPQGFEGSATLRAPELPWLGDGSAGYEDWYLVDDWSALGVLEAAAVAAGHRTAHDAPARLLGEGTAGVFHRRTGRRDPRDARSATWVKRPPGSEPGELLADGTSPGAVSLWQRALVLGNAPEFCLLGDGPGAGARPTRLPPGWRTEVQRREPL